MLSAVGSQKSLSSLIATIAGRKGWSLTSSAYCRVETNRNVVKFGSEAETRWKLLRDRITFVPDALTSRWPLLLTASKDKPILITALAAHCDVLLTPDRGDFGILLETEVYGMFVTTPRGFLVREGLG